MRTLALRKETLASLTDADLGSVAGASGVCVSDGCLTWAFCLTDPCIPETGLNCLPTNGCA